VIERIVAPLGLRVDESSPWVDARLSDGSRVQTRFLNTPLFHVTPCQAAIVRQGSVNKPIETPSIRDTPACPSSSQAR
jgi:hypothetical protein